MKKRILNKKGMTMVEVIIAMAVVMLVTITALSIITSSTHTTQSALHKSQAQHFAEDAFACFRACETADQFADAMAFAGGYSECAVSGSQYTFLLNASRFTAVVTVEYPAGDRASFSIQITDDDDEVITSIPTFTKGA